MNKLPSPKKGPRTYHSSTPKPERPHKRGSLIDEIDEKGDITDNKDSSWTDDQEGYRQKIKLLGRPKQLRAGETRKKEDKEENVIPKEQKLEILNQLLTKKNQLLEILKQNLEKAKEENKLLQKTAFMALENKDNSSASNWKSQLQETFSSEANDIFPEIRKTNHNATRQKDPTGDYGKGFYDESDPGEPENNSLKQKILKLEGQNKSLLRKLKDMEDDSKRKASLSAVRPRSRARESFYEEEQNEEIRGLLDEAIAKIKAMEYELQMFEQKNEYLQNELMQQKRVNAFNDQSYMRLQENQRKLVDENTRLQRSYQEAIRELNKFRNSSFVGKY